MNDQPLGEIVCTGLNGANPLHLLAALGTVRLLSDRDLSLKVFWRGLDAWRPVLLTALPRSEIPALLAARLNALGATRGSDQQAGLQRRVREVSAARKKAAEELDQARRTAATQAKTQFRSRDERNAFVDSVTAEHKARLDRLAAELREAQTLLGDSLGNGIAHLGDIIGVDAGIFRRRAREAVENWFSGTGEPLVAEALAAQAVDGITDNGRMTPTPFSFSNGASGQCLLKDFRNCAAACRAPDIEAALFGKGRRTDAVTGLNWDPAAWRSYALRWEDPASGSDADPAANALAFVGLSLLPVVPLGRSPAAVGWTRREAGEGFLWPIWVVPVGLETLRALLASPAVQEAAAGVPVRMFSQRINPDRKRYYFAPAEPL